MFKTIIVDDEIRGLQVLELLLSTHKDFQIVAACTDSEEAITKINELRPDLVLLDIEMPRKNGFEVLKNVSYKDFKCIFVTAFNEYAIQAFKYAAIDYLLKPVDDDVFHASIRRASDVLSKVDLQAQINVLNYNLESYANPLKMKICIPNVNGFNVININDIVYCQSDDSYTIFKLNDGSQLISSKTLHDFEQILSQDRFCRIHRSYMINLTYIKEYNRADGGYVIMHNDIQLEVSRRKKEEFKQVIHNYFSKI